MVSKIEQGLAFHDAGELARAEQCYREALAADPTAVDALKLLALVAAERGQTSAAITYVETAITARPEVAQFHHLLGRLKVHDGKLDEAVAAMRNAAARASGGEKLQALADLGLCLEQQDKWEEANAVYAEVLASAPDNKTALHGKAGCAAALGQLDVARAAFQRLLALDPTDAGAREGLQQVDAWLKSRP